MKIGLSLSTTRNQEPLSPPISSPWVAWNGSLDGAPSVVTNTLAGVQASAALSASLMVDVFISGVDGTLYAVAGTSSANIISWGTPVQLDASVIDVVCEITVISSTSAVIGYNDTSNMRVRAVAISVSGATVTPGTPIDVATTITSFPEQMHIATLSSTKVIAAYIDENTSFGNAIIIDVSGTTLTTPGVALPFNIGCSNLAIGGISSTQAIVTYDNVNDVNQGLAQILDISGDVVTGNTEYQFSANTTSRYVLAPLSSSKWGCLYQDTTNSNHSYIIILSVSGVAITNGSPAYLTDANNIQGSIGFCKADGQTFFSVWKVDATHIKAATISIVGTAATVNSLVQYKSTNTTTFSCSNIDNTHIITCYRDNASSNHTTSRISAAV